MKGTCIYEGVTFFFLNQALESFKKSIAFLGGLNN